MIAHLSVVALVAFASLAGLASAQEGAGSSIRSATAFLPFVSSVRGAAEQAPSTVPSAFEPFPADEAAFVNRAAPAVYNLALPTPVAIDPNATPLAAPGTGIGGVAQSVPSTRGGVPAPASGGLVWPVPAGSVSQYFHAGHLALDIAASYGAQVVAAQGGVVTSAGWRNNGGGYVISIDHGNGMQTEYNHLGSIWVSSGQYVSAGQGIAGVGCTGICTGPHVHFVVIVNGVIDNPSRYY